MYSQSGQRGVLLEQQLWKLLQLVPVQPPAAGKTSDQPTSPCVCGSVRVCVCVRPAGGWE